MLNWPKQEALENLQNTKHAIMENLTLTLINDSLFA